MIQIAAPSRLSPGVAPPPSSPTGAVGGFARLLAGSPGGLALAAPAGSGPAELGQGAAGLAGNGLPTPADGSGTGMSVATVATTSPTEVSSDDVLLPSTASDARADLPSSTGVLGRRTADAAVAGLRARYVPTPLTSDDTPALSGDDDGEDRPDTMLLADAPPGQPGCWVDQNGRAADTPPVLPATMMILAAAPSTPVPAMATPAAPDRPTRQADLLPATADPIGPAASVAGDQARSVAGLAAQVAATPPPAASAWTVPLASVGSEQVTSAPLANTITAARALADPTVSATSVVSGAAPAVPEAPRLPDRVATADLAAAPDRFVGAVMGAAARLGQQPVALSSAPSVAGTLPTAPTPAIVAAVATPNPDGVSPTMTAARNAAVTLPLQVGTAAPAAQVFASAITAAGRQDRADAPPTVASARRGAATGGAAVPVVDGASMTGVLAAAGAHGIAAPTAGEGATLDLADRHWPTAMVDHIERLRDEADAASTRIRVVPDALGGIDVALRRHDDGAVQVTLSADQPATRVLLADARPELNRLAETRGIRLADTDQMGGGMTGGGATGGFAGQASDGQQRRPANPATPPRSVAPTAVPLPDQNAEPLNGRLA